jgi:hypothetical protein
MYLDERGPNAAVEILDSISSTLPIHLVLGQVKDYMQVTSFLLLWVLWLTVL